MWVTEKNLQIKAKARKYEIMDFRKRNQKMELYLNEEKPQTSKVLRNLRIPLNESQKVSRQVQQVVKNAKDIAR